VVLRESELEAVQARTPAKRRWTPLIGAILFAFAFALPLLRQRGARSWQTIWWEDGSIYYEQAKLHGVSVLFRGYDGYLQLPPRALGIVATAVPIRDLPVYFALVSALICSLVAWFVYHYCEGWITSVPVLLALAALIVLMPALGFENTADITDVIWVFLMALPWALISVREERQDVAIRSFVTFVAATSSVLCVFFIPFALGYALYRKTRGTWIVVSTFAAGMVLQIAVALRSQRVISEPRAMRHITSLSYLFGHPSPYLLARFTGLRVFVVFVTGGRGIAPDWRHGDGLLILGCVALIAIVLAVLMPGAGRKPQALAGIFVAYALVIFAWSVWESGLGASTLRYSVLPVFLLASAIAVLVSPPGAERSRRAAVVGRPLFVAYLVAVIVIGFSVINARSAGPTWQAALTSAYQSQCVGAASNKLVVVPTQAGIALFNPADQLSLPCRDLR
jgi:hypothetical protein